MTKTQDRQVYLDVAKGMGMLGVVASHCLVETSLGTVSYTHLDVYKRQPLYWP